MTSGGMGSDARLDPTPTLKYAFQLGRHIAFDSGHRRYRVPLVAGLTTTIFVCGSHAPVFVLSQWLHHMPMEFLPHVPEIAKGRKQLH